MSVEQLRSPTKLTRLAGGWNDFFNRRLHALSDWYGLILEELTELVRTGQVFIIDSLPVPVCKFARWWRCRKVRRREFVGYCAAKAEKIFGYRLHLICTPGGKVVA